MVTEIKPNAILALIQLLLLILLVLLVLLVTKALILISK